MHDDGGDISWLDLRMQRGYNVVAMSKKVKAAVENSCRNYQHP